MSKHTPGPWQAVVGDGAGSFWLIHQKTEMIDGGYFGRVDAMHTTEEARRITRANAKLFAAAPDLLEACQAFVAVWEKSHQLEKTDVALRLARAAIAKATGEKP